MDVKQQVFLRLKPKANAFGFNKKELQGVASTIANNLNIDDDAEEDEMNTLIDEQIEKTLPFLKLAQAQASRVIEASRKTLIEEEENDDNSAFQAPAIKKSPKQEPTKDEEPAWFKAYREMQDARFAKLEGEKVATTRKHKLESLLKDTGTFGTRTLKSFHKMTFENDEEFDEFFAEVEEDLKSFNQERANAGLEKLGTFPQGNKEVLKKEEPYSDDDIDRLAENF